MGHISSPEEIADAKKIKPYLKNGELVEDAPQEIKELREKMIKKTREQKILYSGFDD